jgi:hypothetical protein
MTDEERQALADELEHQIRPLIDQDKYHGGYNCCGCSTYGMILDHAIAIVHGERYRGGEPDG